MKNKIPRVSLELALSHSCDACINKPIIQLHFLNDRLTITSKGEFTQYEESISIEQINEECVFSLKAATLLEFVKHISSDNIILTFDKEKQSCLVSSEDKKTKIAIQTLDIKIDNIEINNYEISFQEMNFLELLKRLNFASKFCSLSFQDYPLTGIHCLIKNNRFEIKSTNGPAFYSAQLPKAKTDDFEFYLPKKSPIIIRNVFSDKPITSFSVRNDSILIESENRKLKVFLEKCEKDSFPTQIIEWIKKEPSAKVKISIYELAKSLKFFISIASDSNVNFTIKNDTMWLEAKENTIAAKESMVTEEISGEAISAYNPRFLLDCLESLQSSWAGINFIKMQEDFYLIKISDEDTTALLCPTIF